MGGNQHPDLFPSDADIYVNWVDFVLLKTESRFSCILKKAKDIFSNELKNKIFVIYVKEAFFLLAPRDSQIFVHAHRKTNCRKGIIQKEKNQKFKF